MESVYHEFKRFGNGPIDILEEINEAALTQLQMDLIKEVNEVYGQFSALKLMNLTHNERPWIETERQYVIPVDLMKEFFLTKIQK